MIYNCVVICQDGAVRVASGAFCVIFRKASFIYLKAANSAVTEHFLT